MQNVPVSYRELVKNLKKEHPNSKKISIAVLADSASQYLSQALVAAAVDQQIQLELWEADYDSIEANVYDSESELYARPFDFILLFLSPQKLYKKFSCEQYKEGFAANKLNSISNLLSILQERTRSKILLSNYAEFDDALFGNYANKTSLSFLYQVRKLNLSLMDLAIKEKNLFVVDVQSLVTTYGKNQVFDPKLFVHADLIYDIDFNALIAINTVKIIASIQGSFKKCVVLDLDNTLWGGIIGDDGLENIQIGDLGIGKAFSNLQLWLRNLKDRGIILAVSSKNTEAIAKEVFEKHPGMTLRLEDISVFSANWETKVDNILFIQSILNIGFDSMVFLDDNPFERNMVRQNIPGITVPELPEDPAEYLPYLQSLNLFETASFSGEDANRTRQYQEEAKRAALQKRFTSEAEFLESLHMKATVQPVTPFSCPRVAQLSQRSNQFNLRTVRYTEDDIKRLMEDPMKFTLSVSLQDNFGDYGLISAVIMEKISAEALFIETWIMSCRVLKRGVEGFLLNEMVRVAKENGCRYLIGEYLPTAKNGLVKDHYQQLGFKPAGEAGKWLLDTDDYQIKPNFIQNQKEYAVN